MKRLSVSAALVALAPMRQSESGLPDDATVWSVRPISQLRDLIERAGPAVQAGREAVL